MEKTVALVSSPFFRVKPASEFDSGDEFCRSLLDPKAASTLEPFKEIKDIRDALELNSQRTSSGEMLMDPGLLFSLDCRLIFPVFIIGDGVYTREEMLAMYPFATFNLTPEKVLEQQEIGEITLKNGEVTYLKRAVGSDVPFKIPSFRAEKPETRAVRTAKSQIFLAGEGWEDFMHLAKTVRAAVRMRAAGGALPAPPKRDAPLALEDNSRAEAMSDLLDSLGLGA